MSDESVFNGVEELNTAIDTLFSDIDLIPSKLTSVGVNVSNRKLELKGFSDDELLNTKYKDGLHRGLFYSSMSDYHTDRKKNEVLANGGSFKKMGEKEWRNQKTTFFGYNQNGKKSSKFGEMWDNTYEYDYITDIDGNTLLDKNGKAVAKRYRDWETDRKSVV